jgi:hypothetical protein
MKLFSTKLPGVVSVLSLCGALACGDDDGSSGSGVSRSKLVSDVTDAEAKKVCEWIERQSKSYEPSKKQLCTAGAVALSTTPDQCGELVEECLTEDLDLDDDEDSDCDDADASEVASCDTVTVGEFESCLNAYLGAFKKQIDSLSCKDAGEEPEIGLSEVPDACEKIVEECPELLSEVGDDEETGGAQEEGFSCGDGVVIPADYACDGEEDCDSGLDEQGC